MFKVNNKDVVFIFNFEHIWHLVLVLLLLTLNMQLTGGLWLIESCLADDQQVPICILVLEVSLTRIMKNGHIAINTCLFQGSMGSDTDRKRDLMSMCDKLSRRQLKSFDYKKLFPWVSQLNEFLRWWLGSF